MPSSLKVRKMIKVPKLAGVSKLVCLAVFISPLFLAACGQGWEPVRTDAFPYGNKRTAGTGVAYVRAKMLPQKELKLEPAPAAPAPAPKAETPAPPAAVPPAKAEEIFRKGQEK